MTPQPRAGALGYYLSPCWGEEPAYTVRLWNRPLREISVSAYLLNTPDDQKAMLATIGAKSVEDLFAPIPAGLRLKRPLDIPPAMSEPELTRHMQRLAGRNRSASDTVCFLGGGAYDHFIPSVVDAVAGRGE